MEHPAEQTLLAYIDEELSLDDRSRIEDHVRSCEACAAQLETLMAAARELSGALARLDVPAPVIAADEIQEHLATRALGELDRPAPGVTPDDLLRRVKRAGVASRVSSSVEVTPLEPRRASRRPLLAAALVVIFVAGASAAIPGSPVREWLARSIETLTIIGEPAPEVSGAADAPDAAPSAISVQPRNGLVRIKITEPAPETVIRLRLLDSGPVSVWSVDGRYRTAPGEIEVLEAGPGDVVVLIPRNTPSAEVELNGRLVAMKEGPDLKLLIPAADSSDTEVSFQTGG